MTIEKLQQNHAKYRRKVEQVRADWTLSDEAKRQQLEKVYGEALETYNRGVEEYRSAVRERVRSGRKRVFSAPKMGADGALNVLSYRDALDRASRITESRQLSDLLARAETTGDHALARAILYRGYELQDSDIVQSYFAKYPDELPAWDSFMDAAEEQNKLESLGASLAIGVAAPEKPQDLGRQNAYTASGV